MPTFAIVVVVIIAAFIFTALRVLREYERGVMFSLGRFGGVKGPGVVFVWPIVQQMTKVDLRVIVLQVPKQDVILRDNVSVKVSAVVYFRIVDPAKAIIQVANPYEATSQLAQTTLRSILGQHETDEMLSQREKLNADIQHILDQNTDAWGIKVANVEIKRSAPAVRRSSTPKARSKRRRRWSRRLWHCQGTPKPCSCVICKRSPISRATRAPSSRSRCRST
jgi:regulator of protease activity HflC (stomatin/prohibitin superfamily)